MTTREHYAASEESGSPGKFARFARSAAIILTSVIVLGWTVLGSLYVRGRVILGHWPKINADDPKSLALGLHYVVAGYSLSACVLGTVGAVVLICVVALTDRRTGRTSIALASAAVLLSVALLLLTPWASWYLD